jgi:hypothetical protein
MLIHEASPIVSGIEVGEDIARSCFYQFQAIQFLCSLKDAASNSDVLQHVLELEQHRFRAWREHSSPISDNLDIRLNEEYVKSSLTKRHTLLIDPHKLVLTYEVFRNEASMILFKDLRAQMHW